MNERALWFAASVLAMLITIAPRRGDASPNAIVVDGDVPGQGLRLETVRSRVSRDIALTNESDRAITGLSVRVPSLQTTGNVAIPVTASVAGSGTQGLEIGAHQQVMLHLEADLTTRGEYRGTVILVHENEPRTIALIVTHALEPLDTTVESLDPVHANLWPWEPVEFLASVRNAGIAGRSLHAHMIRWASITGDTRSTASPRVSINEANRLDGTIHVNSGDRRDLHIRVDGLPPGQYSAVIELSADGVTTTTQPVSIFVRYSISIAAIVIALGGLGGALLRKSVKLLRPRFERIALLSRLQLGVDDAVSSNDPLEPTEKEVLDAVRRKLATLKARVDADAVDAEITPQLAVVTGKVAMLPTWLAARRAVAALRPDPRRESMTSEVEKAAALLSRPEVKKEDLDAQSGKIQEVLERVARVAFRQAVDDRLNAILTDLMSIAASSPGIPEVDEARRAAAELLANSEEGTDALQLAAKKVESKYVGALAKVLVARVAGAPPLGFSVDAWAILQASAGETSREVERLVTKDPGAAYASFAAAYTKIVDSLTKQLQAAIEARVTALGTLSAADQQSIENARQALSRSRSALGAERLADAAAEFDQAQVEFAKLPPPSKGQPMGGAPVPAPAPAASVCVAIPAGSAPPNMRSPDTEPPRNIAERTLADAQRRMMFIDASVLVVGVFIGLLSGLSLLWSSNAAWGSPMDLMIAFAWGLGLQEVAGKFFTGPQFVSERLSG